MAGILGALLCQELLLTDEGYNLAQLGRMSLTDTSWPCLMLKDLLNCMCLNSFKIISPCSSAFQLLSLALGNLLGACAVPGRRREAGMEHGLSS